MQAIETEYAGYRFRSRLEARWAVFFSELGLDFEYEKEGYQLSWYTRDGVFWYLPDFWIPSWNAFVEIKGEAPTDDELEKCQALRDEDYGRKSKKVIIFIGDPMSQKGVWFYNTHTDTAPMWETREIELRQCSNCDAVWACSRGYEEDRFMLKAGERCTEKDGSDCWQSSWDVTDKLLNAMKAARREQFNWGKHV